MDPSAQGQSSSNQPQPLEGTQTAQNQGYSPPPGTPQATDPSGGQQSPQGTYQDPYGGQPVADPGIQSTPQQSAPPAQQTPPPPPPSGSKKKMIFLLGGIGVLIVGVVIAVVFIQMQSPSQALEEEALHEQDEAPTETPIPASPSPTSIPVVYPQSVQKSHIAYVEKASQAQESDTLFIYEPLSGEVVFEYSPEASGSSEIVPMQWSPDGSILPFLVIDGDASSMHMFELFSGATQQLAVSSEQLVTSIFSEALPSVLWEGVFQLGMPSLTSPDTGGPAAFAVEENRLVASYNPEEPIVARSSYLTVKQPTSTSFLIGSPASNYTYSLSGVSSATVVGVTAENLLVVLEGLEEVGPQSSSIGEVRARFLHAELSFINMQTGSSAGTVVLGSDDWYTVGVQMTPDQDHIIVHQIDSIANPETERFIQYTIETARPRLLFSDPLVSGTHEYALGMIETGASFWVIPGSDVLAMYSGEIAEDNTQSIVLHNMRTKEVTTLCEGSCAGLRVFNPHAVSDNTLRAL